MDFLAYIAQPTCEHQFHLRVHVLHAFLDHEFVLSDDGEYVS